MSYYPRGIYNREIYENDMKLIQQILQNFRIPRGSSRSSISDITFSISVGIINRCNEIYHDIFRVHIRPSMEYTTKLMEFEYQYFKYE